MEVKLDQALGLVMSLLKLELQKKLTIQGYGTAQSSALIRSIEPEIETVGKMVIGSMYMNDYYIFVEERTPPERIPFGGTGGPRRGGTSQYIQGLVRFFTRKLRLGFKEALRASFATANKHKKEGRPTKASSRFSRDGTRTGFIKDTLDKNLEEAQRLLTRQVGNEIELTFSAVLRSLSADGFKVAA